MSSRPAARRSESSRAGTSAPSTDPGTFANTEQCRRGRPRRHRPRCHGAQGRRDGAPGSQLPRVRLQVPFGGVPGLRRRRLQRRLHRRARYLELEHDRFRDQCAQQLRVRQLTRRREHQLDRDRRPQCRRRSRHRVRRRRDNDGPRPASCTRPVRSHPGRTRSTSRSSTRATTSTTRPCSSTTS